MGGSTSQIAKKIVEQILDDLRLRYGFGDAWYDTDEDIQEEIKQEWENIVFCELGGEPTL